MFAQYYNWERVGPPTFKLTPRYYTDTYGHAPNFHPPTGVESPNTSIASSNTHQDIATPTILVGVPEYNETSSGANSKRWSSRAQNRRIKEPGDGTPQFPFFYVANVHHAVFQSRPANRTVLTWMDFPSTGLTRTDVSSCATPSFSAPLVDCLSSRSQPQPGIIRKPGNISPFERRRGDRRRSIHVFVHHDLTSTRWMDGHRTRGALPRVQLGFGERRCQEYS